MALRVSSGAIKRLKRRELLRKAVVGAVYAGVFAASAAVPSLVRAGVNHFLNRKPEPPPIVQQHTPQPARPLVERAPSGKRKPTRAEVEEHLSSLVDKLKKEQEQVTRGEQVMRDAGEQGKNKPIRFGMRRNASAEASFERRSVEEEKVVVGKKLLERESFKFMPLENPSIHQVRARLPLYASLLSQTKPPGKNKYPSPERKAVLMFIAGEMAGAYGFEPHEILGQVFNESGFRERAVGGASDRGLMQITQITEVDILRNGLRKIFPKRKWNVFDPICNLDAGIGYLDFLRFRAQRHGVEGSKKKLQRARAYFNVGSSGYLRKSQKRKAGDAYASRVAQRAKEFAGMTPERLFVETKQKVPRAFQ